MNALINQLNKKKKEKTKKYFTIPLTVHKTDKCKDRINKSIEPERNNGESRLPLH